MSKRSLRRRRDLAERAPAAGTGSGLSARVPGYVFAGMGLVAFSIGLFLAVDRLILVDRWTETLGTVTESRVEGSGGRLVARIRVQWSAGGETVETEPTHAYDSLNYARVAEAVERFPAGSLAPLRYDPDNPRRARLEAGFNLQTFGLGLLLLGGGAVFGGVGVLALHFAGLDREARDAEPRRVAYAKRAERRAVALFVGALGVVDLGAAVATAPRALATLAWPVLTARLQKAEVYARSDRGLRGRTVTRYVGRLYLAYERDGREYVSAIDRRGTSSDRATMERLLAAIPKEAPPPIRIDPARPHRIEWADSWPLLLPGVFFGTGILVFVVAVWVGRSSSKDPGLR